MTTLILGFRTVLFYLGYLISLFWFGLSGILLFSFFPYQIRYRYILLWNRFLIFWLKITCNLRVEVIDKENLPAAPYVALAKHQSQWETYFLQFFLAPVSIVLKRELLNVPFFGWGLRLTNPIAIDRNNPKQALKQILEKGKARISNNISVLIFPEGTRVQIGKEAKFARGGANIAVASAVPVVPIALNAGEYWPTGQFLKYPGTITVKIGAPISSVDFTSREITEKSKAWIDAEVAAMSKRH